VAPAQVKNSFSSVGEIDASISPSTLVLKLSVTNTALRYFVLSETHHQVIFFGDYTLHNINSAPELVLRLEKIFEKDEILQLPFSKIWIGMDEKYSLVPNEFSFMINRTEQLTQPCSGAEIVFESPDRLVETLKRLFPLAELLHLNSTYLNMLPAYLSSTDLKLFVNVSRNYLDIIYFDAEKNLKLMNRYDYQAATDFIYFVLLCCEELKLDRETIELRLMGEVDIQSKIYDLCHRYFRNIAFIQKPDAINFTRAFEVFPKHLHFNLYNLSACE
jgi:hypothetical protein